MVVRLWQVTFSEVKPVGFANKSDVSSEREDHGWLVGFFFFSLIKQLFNVETIKKNRKLLGMCIIEGGHGNKDTDLKCLLGI